MQEKSIGSRPDSPASPAALCVDLDGTLIRSDLLAEAVFALIREHPLYLLLFPFWLLKGKAHFKQAVAQRVPIDASVLPYHDAFLAYLKQQRAAGRQLVLATAANIRFAEAVAQRLWRIHENADLDFSS